MQEGTYGIPVQDEEVFRADLPLRHQREIEEMLRVFWAVDHSPHKARMETWRAEIRRANMVLESVGIPGTFRRQTLYGLRKRYHASGMDWAVLVNRAKVPDWDRRERRAIPRGDGLPSDFVDFFKGLAQRHNRSSEQAIEELRRRWRAGEAIPGYGVWTSWFARRYPAEPLPAVAPLPPSWSGRTLRRLLPSPAALAGARRGIAAATSKLPTIVRTREGLRPMEYVVFDDWRADFLVFVPGVQQAVELHGILSEDVASARPIRYGIRPALPREDGSNDGLKRVDTKSLVVDLLIRHGYPLDYRCNFIFENGTATLTPADAQAIEDVTDGHIKCHWTSMISGRVFGWEDRPIGDFRGKSWLESFFNLLHNACGNIPGQIGAHYEKRPKSIPARVGELKALVKAEQALPAHLRDTLNYRMPFPSLLEAKAALDFVFNFLSHREHHRCEGFDRILKVRLTRHDPWRSVHELQEQGIPVQALMALGPRPMVETPAERWKKLSRDVRWARVPIAAMPILLSEHRWVTVETEGEINLGSKSKPILYRDRRSPHLTVGRKFLAYVSTTDDEWCHLTDGRRYVCSLRRARALSMTDAEAVSREIGEKAAQLKRTLRQIRAVDLDAPQRLADVESNLRLAEAQLAAQNGALLEPAAAQAEPRSVVAIELRGAEDTLSDRKARAAAAAERVARSTGDLDSIFEKPSRREWTEPDVSEQVEAADALARMM